MESLASPFQGSEDDASEQLDALLRDAVRVRMRSDVPLGAFLSGGVDSSTVVALMQAQNTMPVQTFSIGVHDAQYNEAAEAARVAHHLSTDHTELYVTPAEAMEVIPKLASMYDEPFADSSQIPTYLVARLARQKVTVCLSGDGGDELFGGYNRHVWCEKLLGVPRLFRKSAASALTALPPPAWDRMFRLLSPLMPQKYALRMPGYKLHKLASVLSSSSVRDLYTGLRTHWDPDEVLLSNDLLPAARKDDRYALHPAERMMILDTTTYLPDDILAKLDRATMAVGLEARIPFLDPRVFEFAWHLPLSMKLRHGRGKWILRKVLSRYVPGSLTERPKAGFGIPLDRWLAGPLRGWCEDLLEDHRLRQQGIFDPTVIRRTWEAYLAGQTFWTWHLWDVLMFQSWLEENKPTRSAAEPRCLQPLP
jgi:asparagine synthase (glutamine-hydrolysing)